MKTPRADVKANTYEFEIAPLAKPMGRWRPGFPSYADR